MTETSPRAPWKERVVRLGRREHLAGIMTFPSAPDSGATGLPVIILGAGIIHKVGPSRVSVELARKLAAGGHPTLRFDLSGIGDSARASADSLESAVMEDLRDAVSFTIRECGGADSVALVGFCSGADNGLHIAAEDPRIHGVVLFDPTVHRTAGFHHRRNRERLKSPESWANVLSGRSLWLRAVERLGPAHDQPPPDYYGLLVSGPEETDRKVGSIVGRGGRLLYCLSGGARRYCNAPEQVSESLPTGFSEEHVSVAWRPDLDHIFSRPEQREAFAELTLDWLRAQSF